VDRTVRFFLGDLTTNLRVSSSESGDDGDELPPEEEDDGLVESLSESGAATGGAATGGAATGGAATGGAATGGAATGGAGLIVFASSSTTIVLGGCVL